jgi:hypothetical protein
VSSLTSLQRVLPEVMLALFLIDLLFVEVNHLCSVIMLGKQVTVRPMFAVRFELDARQISVYHAPRNKAHGKM